MAVHQFGLVDQLSRSSWGMLSVYILILLAGLSAVQTFRSWYRLSHFDGPRLAAFSKLWLVRHVQSGRMHLDFAEVNQKYGSLARISPMDIITSDPAVMRRILEARSPYRRSDWYVAMRFDPAHDHVESQRDPALHQAMRKKLAHGYSGKENENLESAIDRNIAALVNLIDSKYVSSETVYRPLDFGKKAQYFTLDTISDIAYSRPFGFLSSDSDKFEYIKTTEDAFPAIMMVTIFPWLNWVLQLSILKSFMPSEKDMIGFGKAIGITKEVVAERYGPERKTERDMLQSFVRHGLTQKEAETETLVQVVAGNDTTATAIRGTMLHIITNPRVLEKLRAEISAANVSSPISNAEASKLPYLQAIIKEGLRIWPPVAGLMSKEAPPEGDTINGKFIPGGTKIGYCAWGIFRDKDIFGEDAHAFRPERWIEDSSEQIKRRELTLELIFSFGKYRCLGRDVAQMELNKIFVELLRNFDFSVDNPLEPCKAVCNGVFMISDMWLTVTRREKK